jgi:nucleoside-diphosphate kinase
MGERYAFTAEWLDPMAQIVWKFQLLFYTQDNTIEMYDIKNRRTFLKRSPATNLSLGQIYVGATITLHARQLHIVEYADDFTKRTLSMTRQKTLALIKPDGVANMGKIVHAATRAGFTIGKLKMTHLSPEQASFFYSVHQGQPFYQKLVGFMTSGPIVAMELVAEDAVSKWRACIGPTNSSDAKATAPNSIRAQFGTDQTCNAVHGSDSDMNADMELDFFFGPQAGISRKYFSGRSSTSLVIIKPHALKSGNMGLIVDAIQERLAVTAAQSFVLERQNAQEFLEVYKGVVPPAEYSGMVEQLTSGMFIALEVCDADTPDASPVDAVRELCGPPDPEIGRVLRPYTLRAKFGEDKLKNAVHCTDLEEDGSLEVTYFFDLLP